jgi:hypothetical protein
MLKLKMRKLMLKLDPRSLLLGLAVFLALSVPAALAADRAPVKGKDCLDVTAAFKKMARTGLTSRTDLYDVQGLDAPTSKDGTKTYLLLTEVNRTVPPEQSYLAVPPVQSGCEGLFGDGHRTIKKFSKTMIETEDKYGEMPWEWTREKFELIDDNTIEYSLTINRNTGIHCMNDAVVDQFSGPVTTVWRISVGKAALERHVSDHYFGLLQKLPTQLLQAPYLNPCSQPSSGMEKALFIDNGPQGGSTDGAKADGKPAGVIY